MSTDLLIMHLATSRELLLSSVDSNNNKGAKAKKSKKPVKSHLDRAKDSLANKSVKLKSAIERLGTEKRKKKHSHGDILKVIKANKGAGKLKIPKFVKSDGN